MSPDPSLLFPVLTMIVGVTAWVLLVRLQVGRLVSPFSIGLLVLLSIYGVRPIMMIGVGDYAFYGLDVRSGFNRAAFVGFVATCSFVVGYLLSGSRRHASAEPVPRLTRHTPRTLTVDRAFVAVIGFALFWVAVVAVVGGGIGAVPVLFEGRTAAARAAFAGVPVVLYAAPTAGAAVMAYARITTERVRALTTREKLVFWVGVLLSCVPPLAQGSRRFIVPVLLVGVLAAVVPRWRRIVSPMWIVSGIFGVFVLMAIPYVRSAGSRAGGPTDLVGALIHYGSGQGVSGVLSNYFLTYDTEMFDYVAYLSPRLGDSIPYGAGRGTVGDLLLNPLPAGLSNGHLWSDRLLTTVFGAPCASGVCPVPSMPGVLLYDLGLIGVVLGMLGAGVFAALVEARLPVSSGAALVAWLSLAAFAPVLMRGNTVDVLWIVANVFVLAVLAIAVLGRRAPREPDVVVVPARGDPVRVRA